MKGETEKTAAKNLRLKGYDVESYGGAYQASKGLCKSEWRPTLADVLADVVSIEKTGTTGI